MRVLLIEDDAMSREVWTLLLGNAGYQVTGAESGDQALQLLQEDRREERPTPDVVLADVQMPGLSGAALAAALREAFRHGRERPVVLAMSASEPRRTVLKEYDGFVLKPFTMEALGAAISAAELRAGTGVANQMRQPALAAQAGPATAKVLDEAVFEHLLATMPEEKLRELYAFCMGDTRMRLERMRAQAAWGYPAPPGSMNTCR